MKTPANYSHHNRTYLLNKPFEVSALMHLPLSTLKFGTGVANQVNHFWPSMSPDTIELLTDEAKAEIHTRAIPNLENICRELLATFFQFNNTHSALQFIPVLKHLTTLNPVEVDVFMKNPKTNHTLVDNHLLKVVLVHWKTGQMSNIHGHAKGGCVFKVLKGKIEEIRYSPDGSQQFLAATTLHAGGMAYIDDEMAYHAVGNPFDESAISLHVYAKK